MGRSVKSVAAEVGSTIRLGPRALDVLLPKRHILILSHMRSYSSLLCHILNSNPDVAGYVETHRSYSGSLDFAKLRRSVLITTEGRLDGRYVLDKLLHNHAKVAPDVLRRDDVSVIFSVREPERSIRSTIAMGRKLPKADWKADPTKVVDYYVRRMEQLLILAELEIRSVISIDAEALIDDTPTVLQLLTDFLSLSAPLTEQYQTSEFTGKPRYGDPSRFIGEGTIIRSRDDYGHIDLSIEEMLRATAAYERTMMALSTL